LRVLEHAQSPVLDLNDLLPFSGLDLGYLSPTTPFRQVRRHLLLCRLVPRDNGGNAVSTVVLSH